MLVKIMRGLPGSGKTHYVNTSSGWHRAALVSADNFQLTDGKYDFKPERAREAHKKCFAFFLKSLENRLERIYVDNTNTDPVEIAPYYKMAEHFDYRVEILWMKTPLEVCLARQTHNVPISTMCNMYWNLQKPLPKFWEVVEING